MCHRFPSKAATGLRLVAGIVLTMDATGRRLHDNLFALPIEALW